MELADLQDHERLVLIGLVKLIVHADAVVSAEEKAVLGKLQTGLGAGVWNAEVRRASTALPTIADLEAAARQVGRVEAQHLIHDVLQELAGSDELIDAEEHVLRWVDQTWGVTGDEDAHDEEDDEDEDGDDDAIESFVLIADDDD